MDNRKFITNYTTSLNLKISSELKQRMMAAASKKEQGVSTWVRLLIIEKLKEEEGEPAY